MKALLGMVIPSAAKRIPNEVRPALGQRSLRAERLAGGSLGLRRLAQAPAGHRSGLADQSTWATSTDPAWLYRRWKGSPRTMVFSVAMLPVNVPGVPIRACGQGTCHAHGRRFGQARGRAHGRPGSPEPAPGVTPALSRPQVIIWAAGHGRSC